MYTIIILILLAIAGILIHRGISKRRSGCIVGGILVIVFTILFFWFLDFLGEMLWFEAIGYSKRFFKVIFAKVGFATAGALFGLIYIAIFTYYVPKDRKNVKLVAKLTGIFTGSMWGFSNWDIILKYVNKVSTGVTDPIIGMNTGFYLFGLPFYERIFVFLVLLSLIAFGFSLFTVLFRFRKGVIEIQTESESLKDFTPVYLNGAVLLFILAFGKFLARYKLMYSGWGVVTGPGWTDVNIRLPAYSIAIILTIVASISLLIPTVRAVFLNIYKNRKFRKQFEHLFGVGTVFVLLFAVWFLILTVIPGLFQWLRVEPNEITFEKEYIKNNINMTRHGFGLDDVEEREFPVTEIFTQKMVDDNQNLFSNIRLWDWRALDAVYKQFQEIRLYYEFKDVDIDRYTILDEYKQVMVSAREIEIDNLPEQSQTFVNKRFKYTHGYGITLTTVSDFTPDGLPNLLIKDIPPKSKSLDLEVKMPQIYYGELTTSYVVVNSDEKEFDYPSGEKNVYIQYSGKGGVKISNVWRKFLFGWKFDGTKFFFSGYPNSESRLMFHRQIRERAKYLAPFLDFDDDPYIVLANGKLYWIIDAYTTSDYFPYSEVFSSTETIKYKMGESSRFLKTQVGRHLDGINYIRNSVKVVVDAYNGNVDFYIFDTQDPLIQVWKKIFPNIFKNSSEMPIELKRHIRYPMDMLLVQGLVYAKYHMSDPTVFYNQEDLWIRATEKYYNEVQPVDPYYIMWEPPDKDEAEFVLILPFTPKNRQVMIGWIAGMCDMENYGRFLAYKFPKDKRVLGTQQVETKIDQDRFLSGQLTLWDQRGSEVIRGNVLAIPIEETIIYVEPIYLQAETAAYPELRLVVVMHNDNLSYAETFDEAIKRLFKEIKSQKKETLVKVSFDELIQKANDSFENYLKYLGQKRFEEAAKSLEILQYNLQKLSEQSKSESK